MNTGNFGNKGNHGNASTQRSDKCMQVSMQIDFNQHHQRSQPILVKLPKTERFKICLAAASYSTWTDRETDIT